jgi:hypothetical protein
MGLLGSSSGHGRRSQDSGTLSCVGPREVTVTHLSYFLSLKEMVEALGSAQSGDRECVWGVRISFPA